MWQVRSSDKRRKEDPLFDSPLLRVDVTVTKKTSSLLVTASRSQERRQLYTFVKTVFALNKLLTRCGDVYMHDVEITLCVCVCVCVCV